MSAAFALTPSTAAMVRWRIEDMEPEAAARDLCIFLGLDAEVERLILQMLWEVEEQAKVDAKAEIEREYETYEEEAAAEGGADAREKMLDAAREAAEKPGASIASVLKALEDAR